jgi:nucleoid-associated protein YgaU
LLKLGNFTFDIDDYPASIQMGGTSDVSIQKYPGGRKSVQNLGAFQDPYTLQGTFVYNGAVHKMNQINAMWYKGQPVQLHVPSFSPRWVIITSFKYKYYNDSQIDYTITLEQIDNADSDAIIYSTTSPSTPSSPSPTTTTTSTSGHPHKKYTVKSGDTLWGIAAKEYGDGSQYAKIVSANNIKNPSLITPGEQLIIP